MSTKDIISQILIFILLVFLQVGVLNKIHLFGVATPILYIYFLMKLPVALNRNLVLIFFVLMGFIIDSLTYTLGVNTLACTLTGFFRYYSLKMYTPKDFDKSLSPSFSSFGKGSFIQYASLLTLLHIVVLYMTEAFSFFNPIQLILQIAGSFVLTMILILIIENFNKKKVIL
ncbi:rod shape-determining protein MreD [Bacteroidales bacterium OttesenSCG-928-I14]|nr:rod shape-determining protein MreD [Bacteroidales bacterium OttesenSCG-928-I14]